MRIVDEGTSDGSVKVVLNGGETAGLTGAWLDVMGWAAERLPNVQGRPWDFDVSEGGSEATFADRASALAFLGKFVPGSLADLDRTLERTAGDYQDVVERDGVVEVSIRYVGDAGSGTDDEPHDATWSDFASYAEAAREIGFEATRTYSDHDTIEVRLVPAGIAEAEPAPAP